MHFVRLHEAVVLNVHIKMQINADGLVQRPHPRFFTTVNAIIISVIALYNNIWYEFSGGCEVYPYGHNGYVHTTIKYMFCTVVFEIGLMVNMRQPLKKVTMLNHWTVQLEIQTKNVEFSIWRIPNVRKRNKKTRLEIRYRYAGQTAITKRLSCNEININGRKTFPEQNKTTTKKSKSAHYVRAHTQYVTLSIHTFSSRKLKNVTGIMPLRSPAI